MLLNLKVKNYALISDIDVSFESGMNIITGETGAGKSILVGALGLVLGKRADSASLRNKSSKCVIEASFLIKDFDLSNWFEENDLDHEDHTFMRREITSSGKSRSFINDTPTSLKVMVELGSKLVEVHSQHDNLQLFEQEFQYRSLDVLADNTVLLRDYQSELSKFNRLKSELKSLKDKEAELVKEADYNQFLHDELVAIDLDTVDEDALIQEQELLENAEELIATFQQADQILGGSEYAIINQLDDLKNIFRRQSTSLTDSLGERVHSVLIELQDISSEIDNEAQRVEINPKRLEEVGDKVGLLHQMKNKHRLESIEKLVELREELAKKLADSSSIAGSIIDLEKDILSMEQSLKLKAKSLATKRRERAIAIEMKINDQLAGLGMEHSMIRYTLSSSEELNIYGLDDLCIDLSSDGGDMYSPLKKSASGGELARINLSLKNLLSSRIQMPCSIFDEIDTGVSGEIARKVGAKMKEMSSGQQVIAITHLPQIASIGKNHLFVYKTDENDRIETKVKTLQKGERISEIAKMISGDNLTEHALEQSKALLRF